MLLLNIFRRIIFYALLLFIVFSSETVSSQNLDTINYPQADLHLGISGINGNYLGTIYQISDKFSFEASYGVNFPATDYLRTFGLGINYHFRYFILNFTYVHFERDLFFSHVISLNIKLFSIDEPGFHWIGGIGGCYEIGKYFSNETKKAGVNFSLALGFTII